MRGERPPRGEENAVNLRAERERCVDQARLLLFLHSGESATDYDYDDGSHPRFCPRGLRLKCCRQNERGEESCPLKVLCLELFETDDVDFFRKKRIMSFPTPRRS